MGPKLRQSLTGRESTCLSPIRRGRLAGSAAPACAQGAGTDVDEGRYTPPPMDIGIFMFPTGDAMRPDDLGAEVEARGFESLWFPEHTHIPTSRRSPFPGGGELPPEYSRSHDPFVALTAAAMNTKRDQARHRDLPDHRARHDHHGQGGGEPRCAFGRPLRLRYRRRLEPGRDGASRHGLPNPLREARGAGRGVQDDLDRGRGGVSWPSRRLRSDLVLAQARAQKPHPPIVLGGGTRYTRQRVVDHCDGWMPIGRDDEAVLRGIEDLRHRAERAGRAMDTISINVFGATPNRKVLDRYAEAGVGRAVLLARPEGRDLVLPRLDRYATLLAG